MFALMTFFRGLFAILLGIALFSRPEKNLPYITAFMGAFWVTSGILSVRWGMESKNSKLLTIVVGIVGIIAGAIAISSNFITPWVSEAILNVSLGIVMVITGIFHITGRMTVQNTTLHRSWSGFLLGVFEIVLGLILVFASTIGQFVYTIAMIWALVGGIALMTDAIRMHREMKAGEIEVPQQEK